MDLKERAQKLIKLAEKIEKEASDSSIFVCSNCNHTASLTEINDRRVKYAAQEDSTITVQPVTINDTVVCPVAECNGNMSYIATDSSEKFYVDSAEGAPASDPMLEDTVKDEDTSKKEDAPEGEDAPKGDSIDESIDNLFEDVETQNAKSKEEKKDKAETTQKARHEKDQKKQETDLLSDKKDDTSDTPKDEDPMNAPPVKTEPDPAAVKDPEDTENPDEEKPAPEKKPKKKKEPIDFGKADVPKFKSKDASERYVSACSRYSL